VGDIVFLSGAPGHEARRRPGLAEGGIQGQTRQALENIKASATLAGVTMEDIAKCTVFLTSVADFQAMNGVYREFFPQRTRQRARRSPSPAWSWKARSSRSSASPPRRNRETGSGSLSFRAKRGILAVRVERPLDREDGDSSPPRLAALRSE
jgi:hypothetical protein